MVLSTVSTETFAAPAEMSTEAHSFTVLPVVKMSSTSKIFLPATAGFAAKAPRKFKLRSAAESVCCFCVRRILESNAGR